MFEVESLLVQGKVISNQPNTHMNGRVLDRLLEIQLANYDVLELLDDNYPAPPLSEHLHPEQTCEVLIGVMIGTQCFSANDETYNTYGMMHGILLARGWLPPPYPEYYFAHSGPRLYHNAGGFCLIEAYFGALLFGPDDVPAHIEIGERLAWRHQRYLLLAWK